MHIFAFFANLRPTMSPISSALTSTADDSGIDDILQWLAGAPEILDDAHVDSLFEQLTLLRQTPLPTPQRVRLLDLIFPRIESLIEHEHTSLRDLPLPISRRLRQRIRALLDLLEILAQDYLNTLALLFDPLNQPPANMAQTTLRRAILLLIWQIQLHDRISATPRAGLWQQLHSTYQSARRLAVERAPGPQNGPSIERIYLNALLLAAIQPSSYTAEELSFVDHLVRRLSPPLRLEDTPCTDAAACFWIDPERDTPATALLRRSPSPESRTWFFNSNELARLISELRQSLQQGNTPAQLDLPDFAATRAGQGVLRRLETAWGNPVKRKFPRRRQIYRIRLHAGLNTLHRLLRKGETKSGSEWMVTNESPDGYALMHVSGSTSTLRVGDIVSIRPQQAATPGESNWHLCIVRWALSDNPEHIEIGLQLLSARPMPARVIRAQAKEDTQTPALLLPATPVHPEQTLVVPSGLLHEDLRHVVLMIEQGNLSIREIRTGALREQTGAVEIFTIFPETP